MIGRAGRKGVDTEGESILLCRESDRKRVEQLVMSDLKPVKSCLIQDNGETLCSSMKRAILEVIVSGVARYGFFKFFTIQVYDSTNSQIHELFALILSSD